MATSGIIAISFILINRLVRSLAISEGIIDENGRILEMTETTEHKTKTSPIWSIRDTIQIFEIWEEERDLWLNPNDHDALWKYVFGKRQDNRLACFQQHKPNWYGKLLR